MSDKWRYYNPETILEMVKAGMTNAQIHAQTGAGETTIRRYIREAREKGLINHRYEYLPRPNSVPAVPPTIAPLPRISPPILLDDSLPVAHLIEQRKAAFEKKSARFKAQKWMTFNVNESGPIAVLFVGDPHVDDNGCNWPLLEHHMRLLARTPHAYGVNLGDSHNNWVGRLLKKYADQDTGKDTAYKLIEWLFEGSGVNWLLMLLGNHDTFTDDGARLLKRMGAHICPMIDWRAQVKLVFPNGRELLMDLAHDHKGHSQWNNLHGQEKVALMGRCPHIVAAGDKHNWAIKQKEIAEQEMVTWLVRARGYKCLDEYAVRNQFDQQEHGHSILAVIDPTAGPVGFVQMFADVDEGMEYFAWKRARFERGHK